MDLRTLIFTDNDCYRRNIEVADSRYSKFQKNGPKGIMVHSTGANNPWLKRYVGPDDGDLGLNQNDNHWNKPGLSKCVHAIIGKLADGSIATYQTLPWNFRAWHCGSSANDTHVSFEICEDDCKDTGYFNQVYREAVELCAYLCQKFNLGVDTIIDHREGYVHGIASNHGDVRHWFKRHGKTMDTFRADVKKELERIVKPVEPTPNASVKVGDIVKIAEGATYWSSKIVPEWVLKHSWIVSKVDGDRVVVDECADGPNAICSPIHAKYLTVVSPIELQNTSFKVRVYVDDLNIRTGPGVSHSRTGKYTGRGVFTIVETKNGEGSKSGWGKLKSGAGWISLDFTIRV